MTKKENTMNVVITRTFFVTLLGLQTVVLYCLMKL